LLKASGSLFPSKGPGNDRAKYGNPSAGLSIRAAIGVKAEPTGGVRININPRHSAPKSRADQRWSPLSDQEIRAGASKTVRTMGIETFH